MIKIGHFKKISCSNPYFSEKDDHQWGWIVVDGKKILVRFTDVQIAEAIGRAQSNIKDAPGKPGLLAAILRIFF